MDREEILRICCRESWICGRRTSPAAGTLCLLRFPSSSSSCSSKLSPQVSYEDGFHKWRAPFSIAVWESRGRGIQLIGARTSDVDRKREETRAATETPIGLVLKVLFFFQETRSRSRSPVRPNHPSEPLISRKSTVEMC